MVLPDSHKVSRAPWYSGYPPQSPDFRLRDCHPLRCAFPYTSANPSIAHVGPTTPLSENNGLGSSAFARHYSQNTLFSSGYLDVSVPRVPLSHLYIQCKMTEDLLSRVSPFGYPRVYRLLTAPRGFSQPTTSFFGIWCLGIPCAPLLVYSPIRSKLNFILFSF